MKTMKIEKKLLFDDKIAAVASITADEKLTYNKEEDGSIRASGPLFIRGEMICEDGGKQPFQEVLDMDVLAPAYKLGNQPFHLTIQKVEHQLEEEGIAMTITIAIEGLKEEHETAPVQQFVPQYDAPVIPPFARGETVNQEEAMDEEVVETAGVQEVEESISENFEDLFEDADTTYTSYRMVVALPSDSYTSIAQRYDVEEEALREVNRNKELQAKTLIVLPF